MELLEERFLSTAPTLTRKGTAPFFSYFCVFYKDRTCEFLSVKYAQCSTCQGPMKVTISATIDQDLANWIDEQVKNKKYRNKSHLIELALIAFKESQKKDT